MSPSTSHLLNCFPLLHTPVKSGQSWLTLIRSAGDGLWVETPLPYRLAPGLWRWVHRWEAAEGVHSLFPSVPGAGVRKQNVLVKQPLCLQRLARVYLMGLVVLGEEEEKGSAASSFRGDQPTAGTENKTGGWRARTNPGCAKRHSASPPKSGYGPANRIPNLFVGPGIHSTARKGPRAGVRSCRARCVGQGRLHTDLQALN